MNLSRWQELSPLLDEALALPADEREAYLGRIEDEELRYDLEALLAVPPERTEIFDRLSFLPAPPSFSAGAVIGHYEVVRELDRGGMATVFEGRDRRNGRRVALKLLPPVAARLSANEDKVLSRFSHKSIATFYESGSTPEGFRFFAMEYVEGVSITAFCEKHALTLEDRLSLFRKIAGAVSYAHQNLVIHRDLKPENILVRQDGEPKLLDFGIAKLLPQEGLSATLTSLEERPLTVAFASPEQLSGDHTTTATDVYSLGVLLCLLLTGNLPYKTANAHELAWAIRSKEPERPSSLVEGKARRALLGDLDSIILRALRKEVELRYSSVADFSEDVRRYLDHEPVSARRGTRSYRTRKFFERHRLGTIGGALAALGTATFVIALLFLRSEALRERDKALRERERAESVSAFLVDMFRVSNPWTNIGETLPAQEVLDGALRKLANAPPSDPALRGTLLRALGRIHLDLGLDVPAQTLLEPALRDLEANQANNRLVAETLADLARTRFHLGRFDQASRDARRALSIGKGISTFPYLDTRLLLGELAFARGRYGEAKSEFGAVLGRAEKVSLLHASAENGLAASFHAEGRYGEAEKHYGESLSIRKQLLGDSHPGVWQVLHNLACLYRDQGDARRALALFRQVRNSYESISDDTNYRATPALMHNLASTLVSEGIFDEADRLLYKSLTGHRKRLSDRHPDIGRTQVELGRLSDARQQYEEAEAFYGEGIRRLEESLGSLHPDTITTENNLAVLWLHQGDREKARTLLRELLGRTAEHPVRPEIMKALRRNLALLVHEEEEPYVTLGIEILDLRSLTGVLPRTPQAALARGPAPRPSRVLFFDDFEDGAINPKKWAYGGRTVREERGELHILRTVTDQGGVASTVPIPLDPNRPLSISRRVKVHAANEFFDGSMAVEFSGYSEKRFGVSYANYKYRGAGEVVTVGFSLFRHNANSHRYAERKADASPLIPPVWDRFFEEKLLYDPRTGEVRHLIDGRERLSYNVGPLPPNATSITLTFSTWGWYTGHYQHMDWIRVEQ